MEKTQTGDGTTGRESKLEAIETLDELTVDADGFRYLDGEFRRLGFAEMVNVDSDCCTPCVAACLSGFETAYLLWECTDGDHRICVTYSADDPGKSFPGIVCDGIALFELSHRGEWHVIEDVDVV